LKYFEDYERHKPINDLNKLNKQQKNVSTISVDKDPYGVDDLDDGNKTPKAKERVSVLETIGGSNNNDNDSSSDIETLQ
jgi:hypothetical protein